MPPTPKPPKSNTPMLDAQRAKDDQRRAINNERQGMRDERRQALMGRAAQREMRRALRKGKSWAIEAASKQEGLPANFAKAGITDSVQEQKVAIDRANNRAIIENKIRGGELLPTGEPNPNFKGNQPPQPAANNQVNPGDKEGANTLERDARKVSQNTSRALQDTSTIESQDPADRDKELEAELPATVTQTPAAPAQAATPAEETLPAPSTTSNKGNIRPSLDDEEKAARARSTAEEAFGSGEFKMPGVKTTPSTQQPVNTEGALKAIPVQSEEGRRIKEKYKGQVFESGDVDKARNLVGMTPEQKAASLDLDINLEAIRSRQAQDDEYLAGVESKKIANLKAGEEALAATLKKNEAAYQVQKKQTEDYFADVIENEYYNNSINNSVIKSYTMGRRENPDQPFIDYDTFDVNKPNFGQKKPIYKRLYYDKDVSANTVNTTGLISGPQNQNQVAVRAYKGETGKPINFIKGSLSQPYSIDDLRIMEKDLLQESRDQKNINDFPDTELENVIKLSLMRNPGERMGDVKKRTESITKMYKLKQEERETDDRLKKAIEASNALKDIINS